MISHSRSFPNQTPELSTYHVTHGLSRVGGTEFTGDQRIWSFIAGWAQSGKTLNGNVLLGVATPKYS